MAQPKESPIAFRPDAEMREWLVKFSERSGAGSLNRAVLMVVEAGREAITKAGSSQLAFRAAHKAGDAHTAKGSVPRVSAEREADVRIRPYQKASALKEAPAGYEGLQVKSGVRLVEPGERSDPWGTFKGGKG